MSVFDAANEFWDKLGCFAYFFVFQITWDVLTKLSENHNEQYRACIQNGNQLFENSKISNNLKFIV